MNWRNIVSQRKHFSISGNFLLTLLLLAVIGCGSARPSDDTLDSFDLGGEYPDTDNVEWHHVKLVNGMLHEEHPIIMYKEDFVNEDYKPTKGSAVKHRESVNRRHRPHQTESEHYPTAKPEKIYFDVLPEKPVVISEDSDANDSKFDTSKIRVEVISLVDNKESRQQAESKEEVAEEKSEPSKQELYKHPKKYHRRMRRNAEEHVVRKRNPYLRQGVTANNVDNFLGYVYAPRQNIPVHATSRPSHPVPGKVWNSLDLEVPFTLEFGPRGGGDDENPDRVIWNDDRGTTRPPRTTTTTRAPVDLSLIFHNSDPSNADFSFMSSTRAPPPRFQPAPATSGPSIQSATSRPSINEVNSNDPLSVSRCVWAIVNCCSSRDNEIRYQCFETLGCTGAFWGLNPCADPVRNNVVNFVGDIMD